MNTDTGHWAPIEEDEVDSAAADEFARLQTALVPIRKGMKEELYDEELRRAMVNRCRRSFLKAIGIRAAARADGVAVRG